MRVFSWLHDLVACFVECPDCCGTSSLEKMPRQVSTTTPPSNEPEPMPMAELDPAAVESMIADNGLNEVTLKVRLLEWRREQVPAIDVDVDPPLSLMVCLLQPHCSQL